MKDVTAFLTNGFISINGVYTTAEVSSILLQISQVNTNKANFRKSADLFAIRQFLKEVPGIATTILNEKLYGILHKLFANKCFITKSIYFDKTPGSNWYVPYHQDLTISVDKRLQLNGFELWTVKQNQFAVQPPLDVLQNIVTIRIHLDETDENNGALKVVAQSHLKGIYRPETIDWTVEQEDSCTVPQGGIMLMKPLTLHSSGRTTNNKCRRVIHLEFSNQELPEGLSWSERMDLY